MEYHQKLVLLVNLNTLTPANVKELITIYQIITNDPIEYMCYFTPFDI
jgi:hypothetical protein